MIEATAPIWLEWVKAPLILLAPDGVCVIALNGAARRLFGAPFLPELPCPLAMLIGEVAAGIFEQTRHGPDAQAGRSGAVVVEASIGGRKRTVSLEAAAVDGPAGHWLVTVQDRITEQQAGSYVSTIYEDLQAILEWLPVGVEIFDDTGNCIFTNTQGVRIFGWGADELNDIEEWWLHAYPDPDYRATVQRAWAEAIATSREKGQSVMLADWLVTCKDGTQKLVNSSFRCIGELQVLVYWDVSEARKMEAELRHHADTDELTGLRNRRRFFSDAAKLLEEMAATGQPVSALMIDLDRFKSINDRYGHARGDAVLREVAETCRRALRDQDVLARLGGEEFAALLPGCGENDAVRIAEHLRHLIDVTPIQMGNGQLRTTVSIGLATSIGPAHDIDQMLADADRGLYAAKHNGRNRVSPIPRITAAVPPD